MADKIVEADGRKACRPGAPNSIRLCIRRNMTRISIKKRWSRDRGLDKDNKSETAGKDEENESGELKIIVH